MAGRRSHHSKADQAKDAAAREAKRRRGSTERSFVEVEDQSVPNGSAIARATADVARVEADLHDAERRGVAESGLLRRRAQLRVASDRLVKIMDAREALKDQLVANGSSREQVEAADRRVTSYSAAIAYHGSVQAARDAGFTYGDHFDEDDA